jgi:hypothetical protein
MSHDMIYANGIPQALNSTVGVRAVCFFFNGRGLKPSIFIGVGLAKRIFRIV